MTNPTKPAAPEPTPDNTPIPGGGSWRWDAVAKCWVDNYAAPATAPQQPTESE